MTEQVPGIELFLWSEKAVQGAAKFRDAVDSAAQAVERIGIVVDKLDGLLDRVGLAAKGLPCSGTCPIEGNTARAVAGCCVRLGARPRSAGHPRAAGSGRWRDRRVLRP
jgi:hypothetical protein